MNFKFYGEKANPWQRGFWLDRVTENVTSVGIGLWVVTVDHPPVPVPKWLPWSIVAACAATASTLIVDIVVV